MNGHPIPYLMVHDSWIALMMILCFLNTCYILAKGGKHLLQETKEIFDSRSSHSHTITQTTSEDVRFHGVLEIQLCLFIALLFWGYVANGKITLTNEYQSLVFLGIFTGIVLLGSILKIILYLFIGWVFFDKITTNNWIRCHFVTDVILEFLLFPLVLIIIYIDISPDIYLPIALILLILAKSLLFFRGIKLFFLNTYSKIYFITYLCALELIPLALVLTGLIEANDFLQLNF